MVARLKRQDVNEELLCSSAQLRTLHKSATEVESNTNALCLPSRLNIKVNIAIDS